jgi:hypothetical protein
MPTWCNAVRPRGYPVAGFMLRSAQDNLATKALIIHSCGTMEYVRSRRSDRLIEVQEAEFRSWGFKQVAIQHPQVISAWASPRPFDLKSLPPIYNAQVAPILDALLDSLAISRINRMRRKGPPPRAVYGRLIVVSGPGAGEVHPLFHINSIGRAAADCDIALRFATGGKRIATLVFEPKTEQFYLMPQSDQVLTVINGEVLLKITKVTADDEITMGTIGVRVEPASSPPRSAPGFEPDESAK